MKLKTLIILLLLAVLLGWLAYYSAEKKKPSLSPSVIGSSLLPNLPANRVAKMVINSKGNVTTVAKLKDKWVVASHFNYPANFDKVADAIRELSELKIGQTVNAAPSQLDSLNLISPDATGTNHPAGTGTMLELRDEKDGLLAALLIGKGFIKKASERNIEAMFAFGGYSEGQYVQPHDGKVYLVAKSLDRITEDGKTWLADDFINVPAADIKELTVSGPDRAPIKLIHAKENETTLSLADLRPEEGTLDGSKVNQMSGALNHLGFDDVADPALTLKETGLDRPITFSVITTNGIIYNIQLGNSLTNDSFDRYCVISVTNEPVAGPKTADQPQTEKEQKETLKVPEQTSMTEKVAALNNQFGHWIYVLKSYRVEPMLLTRADLIKKPEPAKPAGSQTNAPAVKPEENPESPSVTSKSLKTKSKK